MDIVLRVVEAERRRSGAVTVQAWWRAIRARRAWRDIVARASGVVEPGQEGASLALAASPGCGDLGPGYGDLGPGCGTCVMRMEEGSLEEMVRWTVGALARPPQPLIATAVKGLVTHTRPDALLSILTRVFNMPATTGPPSEHGVRIQLGVLGVVLALVRTAPTHPIFARPSWVGALDRAAAGWTALPGVDAAVAATLDKAARVARGGVLGRSRYARVGDCRSSCPDPIDPTSPVAGDPIEETVAAMAWLDGALFSLVDVRAFVSQRWSRGGPTSAVVRVLIDRFNALSRAVVVAVLESETLDERAAVVAWAIDLGRRLFDAAHFHGAMAVLSGLDAAPVARLQATFARLSGQAAAQLASLRRDLAMDRNFARYRAALAAAAPGPAVPFLGCHIHDLALLDETVADTTTGPGVLNVAKILDTARIIQTLESLRGAAYPPPTSRVLLRKVLAMGTTHVLSQAEEDAISLLREPRGESFSELNIRSELACHAVELAALFPAAAGLVDGAERVLAATKATMDHAKGTLVVTTRALYFYARELGIATHTRLPFADMLDIRKPSGVLGRSKLDVTLAAPSSASSSSAGSSDPTTIRFTGVVKRSRILGAITPARRAATAAKLLQARAREPAVLISSPARPT